ncbi:MAG: hypothetical protein V2J62_11415, partial [candidate division KSB1 bacterium]|nr:hypothetical protein [candidate division KSB1 bacterium]
MKKYITTAVISLFFAINLFGQGVNQESWADGDTASFSDYTSFQGVVIDSTVRLVALSETKTAASFQFILYGEDGIWPIQDFPISSAHDVDYISENKQYYLITDGFGRRVFEINYTNPDNPIEAGFSFTGDQLPLVNPVDASVFYESGNRKVLITDNGGHRVIKVDRVGGDEEWAYGDGTSGIGPNQLSGPSDAIYLSDNGHILICDQGNSRIIEVNPATNLIEWIYMNGNEFNPVDIEYSAMTNEVLVTDQKNHRVFFLEKNTDNITWQFGTTGVASKTDSTLNTPTDADLLLNGNILICDSKNSRLLEVNRSGDVVWSFQHRPLINLRDADRLPDNRTIVIADYPPLLKNIPIWIGYSDSLFVSEPQTIGKKVNFDSLFWTADVPSNTSIKMQFRSAANLTELEAAQW